ncbi:hypothetical protein [uncultured Algimonas sp.]|uniref:DUF4164 family protein n=1 Tax=uncultured Algimonas sp. TaxID=1547920 RepID=UPI00260B8002|nr:hypothetical protein [uncultured Algimonas sp.]
MTDSANKKAGLDQAARALADALGALETALDPVLAKLARQDTQLREADGFGDDRAKLAAQLDEALETRRQREEEFQALSKQTREELDLTIQVLQQALKDKDSGNGGSGNGGAGDGASHG